MSSSTLSNRSTMERPHRWGKPPTRPHDLGRQIHVKGSRRCLRIDGHRLREQNRHPETDRDVDGRSRRGRSRSCLSNLKTKATSFHCTFSVSSPRCYFPKNIFFLFFFFLFLFSSCMERLLW